MTNMELIPIKHSISPQLEEELSLATLYKNAGMEEKARIIQENAILEICIENQLPIIRKRKHITVGSQMIYGFENKNWDLEKLQTTDIDVPIYILEKIVEIKDKFRLRIAIPSQRIDPILLYKLPLQEDVYLELARWE